MTQPAEPRTLITTALDVAGIVALAIGAGAGVARWLGWFGVGIGGMVLLGSSWLITAAARPRPVRAPREWRRIRLTVRAVKAAAARLGSGLRSTWNSFARGAP